MKCDCGRKLVLGSFITTLGNEIEYMECEKCEIVDVMGMDVEDADL